MAPGRKLQMEIDKTLKKVMEGIKVFDIIVKWDTSQDGKIGKSEWRSHLLELGVTLDGVVRSFVDCLRKFS